MAESSQTHHQVFRPETLSELFSIWNRIPDAVPYAGGTFLIRKQTEMPSDILSLEKIAELHSITRTERYLEIGSTVHLGEIIALGKIVPNAFSLTLQGIANPPVRNITTIGGNVCTGGDTTAPLCALDALYELRTSDGSRWISAHRFSKTSLQNNELLTRIRIPLEEWNYTVYRKFNASDSGGEGGVLILIVQNQKTTLSKIQVVFAGTQLFRNKDSEVMLEGKALPLDMRDVVLFKKHWEEYLENLEKPGLFLRNKILNSIETGIAELLD